MAYSVGLEFDGPIHAYSKGWRGGAIYDDPTPGAFQGIKDLQRRGYAVFVFTARDDLGAVAQWLADKGGFTCAVEEPGDDPVKFWNDTKTILVTNRKLPAAVYIDDRALRFYTWPQTTDAMHEMRMRGGDAGHRLVMAVEAAGPLGRALQYIANHGSDVEASRVRVQYRSLSVRVTLAAEIQWPDQVWKHLIAEFKAAGWGYGTEFDGGDAPATLGLARHAVTFHHPTTLTQLGHVAEAGEASKEEA